MSNYNFLQKGAMWLFNIKPKREIYRNIDEELFDLNEKYKQLAKRSATLESEIAHYKAKEVEERESKKEYDRNTEIAKNLSEEEVELNIERYGRTFSLNRFFFKYFKDKKFRDKFEIADKNDEVAWKFGEWLISDKGFMIITDLQGNPRVVSKTLRGLIYKPEGIFNQVEKRARLLLAVDKNGDFVPDIDDYEVPIPIFNEEKGKYEKTNIAKKKARELIIIQQDKIREQDERIETLEITNNQLKEELRDLQRADNINRENLNTKETAFSKASKMMLNTSREITDMALKITNLTETKASLEMEIGSQKGINQRLLNEIENTGSQTQRQRAMAIMKDARDYEREGILSLKEEKKEQLPPINQ